MKVKWMPQAVGALYRIAEYISVRHGQARCDSFLNEAYDAGRMLERNPEMGKAEPLLCGRKTLYRSFVVNDINKIVYRIMDEQIEIVDFWDVRREPKVLSKQVK